MTLHSRRSWFVYEAARLQALAVEAPIIPEAWEDRDKEFREQMTAVVARQCGPDRKFAAQQLHTDWVKAYEAMGWKYGPARDVEAKTHPDMVPYWDLDPLERDKDEVFIALCEIARLWIRE